MARPLGREGSLELGHMLARVRESGARLVGHRPDRLERLARLLGVALGVAQPTRHGRGRFLRGVDLVVGLSEDRDGLVEVAAQARDLGLLLADQLIALGAGLEQRLGGRLGNRRRGVRLRERGRTLPGRPLDFDGVPRGGLERPRRPQFVQTLDRHHEGRLEVGAGVGLPRWLREALRAQLAGDELEWLGNRMAAPFAVEPEHAHGRARWNAVYPKDAKRRLCSHARMVRFRPDEVVIDALRPRLNRLGSPSCWRSRHSSHSFHRSTGWRSGSRSAVPSPA